MLNFLKKIFPKKRTILVLSVLLFVFLLLPSFSYAQLGARIANSIVGFLVRLIVSLSGAILSLGVTFLTWATGDPLNLSFTDPNRNPLIAVGWKMTRNLANLSFILALAYIGLSTALRISNFNTKKTFSRLLIIALFINFTPVICGLVVDASNIVMHFFLSGSSGLGGIKNAFDKVATSEFLDNLVAPFSSENILTVVILILFGFFGGFIFIAFSFLFIARYFVIWILTILSPLAFFAWIIPANNFQKMFKDWWNQFLQWSFVGVVGAFFIRLSVNFLNIAGNKISSTSDSTLDSFMMFLGVLIFLAIGYKTAFKSSAAGAEAILGGVQKFTQKGLKAAGGVLKGGVVGGLKGAAWAAEKSTRGLREKIAENAEEAGREGEGTKNGKPKRPIAWAMRKTGISRKMKANIAARNKKEIEEEKGKLKDKTPEELYAATKSFLSLSPKGVAALPSKRIAALELAIENKQLKNLRGLGLKNSDIKGIMEDTLKLNPRKFGDFAKANPGIAEEIVSMRGEKLSPNIAKLAGVDMDEKDITNFGSLSTKLEATAGPKAIAQWDDKTTLKEALNSEIVHRNWKPAQMKAAIESFGGKFYQIWKNSAAKENWYKENNMPLYKFIKSGAGQGLGIDFGSNASPGGAPAAPGAPKSKIENISPQPGTTTTTSKKKKPNERFGKHISKI